ncbi:N-acetylglucosamine-6-phosphate deacetylase [Pedococcus bigeumensis]|uniref:N-acetylglucosamine-6-phosphate deacetylase n=1 Tax=Pedococcus bigeumensis TaxID=433644 RepID=UPI002FE8BFDF
MTSASARPTRTLLTGAVVLPDRIVADGAVAVSDGTIAYAGERTSLPGAWVDVAEPDGWQAGLTLLPGLVDIHCHGGNGGEFGPDAASAHRAARHHHQQGSTTVVGSLVSAPAATLLEGARTLGDLVRSGELAGIHVEGPFLSTVRCGAQDPAALVDADVALVAALAEAAGDGALAQLTWAPERTGGDAVPAALAAVGAVGALGHSDADFETASRALDVVAAFGARGGLPLATHLFNGMPPLLSRAPGAAGAAIAAAARGSAIVELIADGVHLDGGTVRMVFDAAGPEHVALVSDSMSASGLSDGAYTLGGLDVAVSGRVARLTGNGSLAGGVSTLLDQVRWLVRDLGIPLSDAVAAASTTPARALALTGSGSLAPGQHADLLVVDSQLVLHRVLRRGSWL